MHNPNEALIFFGLLVIFDFGYLVRCVLDATLVAFYDENSMLETRPKYIAKRFFS